MRKYQLASGKVLEFNLAGIEQAIEVYRSVLNECKNAGLDITVADGESILDIILKNREAVLNIFASKEVMEAIQGCCDKVLYAGNHFSMSLFEDEQAREDFIGVMTIIGVENLRPFFPSLRLLLDAITNLFLKQ